MFLKTNIRNEHRVKKKTQSNIEPSWFPQRPVILYSIGFIECECSATTNTEKSDLMKAKRIDRNPIITRKKTIGVINIPALIQSIQPLKLQKIRITNCNKLRINAKMIQK